VEQAATDAVRELYGSDPGVVTWTLSEIEIHAALCRLEREGAFDATGLWTATERLAELWDAVDSVIAIDAVKQRARRLLRTHALRAADALQLAAALLAAGDEPSRWSLVALDDRLADAARREGFMVVP
jgi:hypothetical protein